MRGASAYAHSYIYTWIHLSRYIHRQIHISTYIHQHVVLVWWGGHVQLREVECVWMRGASTCTYMHLSTFVGTYIHIYTQIDTYKSNHYRFGVYRGNICEGNELVQRSANVGGIYIYLYIRTSPACINTSTHTYIHTWIKSTYGQTFNCLSKNKEKFQQNTTDVWMCVCMSHLRLVSRAILILFISCFIIFSQLLFLQSPSTFIMYIKRTNRLRCFMRPLHYHPLHLQKRSILIFYHPVLLQLHQGRRWKKDYNWSTYIPCRIHARG